MERRRSKIMTDVFIEQVILSSSEEEGQNSGRKFLERLVHNQGIYELNTPGRIGARSEEPIQKLMQYTYTEHDTLKYLNCRDITINKQTKETCCFSSLSAAYELLGDKKAHKVIHDNIDESLKKNPFNFAMYLLRNKDMNIQVKKYGWMQHKILEERSPWPTICQLLGDDGSINHCITTMGDFVFESNSDHVKDLSKETLNWCVSTDKEKCNFLGVVRAMRFSHAKPRKEWKLWQPVTSID